MSPNTPCPQSRLRILRNPYCRRGHRPRVSHCMLRKTRGHKPRLRLSGWCPCTFDQVMLFEFPDCGIQNGAMPAVSWWRSTHIPASIRPGNRNASLNSMAAKGGGFWHNIWSGLYPIKLFDSFVLKYPTDGVTSIARRFHLSMAIWKD